MFHLPTVLFRVEESASKLPDSIHMIWNLIFQKLRENLIRSAGYMKITDGNEYENRYIKLSATMERHGAFSQQQPFSVLSQL